VSAAGWGGVGWGGVGWGGVGWGGVSRGVGDAGGCNALTDAAALCMPGSAATWHIPAAHAHVAATTTVGSS
jgi:hypothetical protein